MSHPAFWTFHIVTLGCKINQYESQAIREAWTALGGREVRLEESPHVFLVNSCAITARGERDTRHALYRLSRHYAAQSHQADLAEDMTSNAVSNSHSCVRILTGCAAPLVAKTFSQQEQSTYFDVLIPPQAKAWLLQAPKHWGGEDMPCASVASALTIPDTVYPFGQDGFSIKAFHRARPVLKVQDGCSHRCTYCIVPLVRGKSVSRPAADIVTEAQRLLEAGHSEIMLSGINLHHYGRDFPKTDTVRDFWDLVALLEKNLAPSWKGKGRLRISSLEPSQLNAKGLDILTSSSLLCPHVHLSLQHGSPPVLKRMGRGHYKLTALQDAVQQLRKAWPLMGIGADILMGFAGETEEDVLATLDLVRELGLSYAHVFPYSIRPGTPAAHFTQQVPHAAKLERAARVRALVEEQQSHFLQSILQQNSLDLVLDGVTGHDEAETPPARVQDSYKGVNAQYASCQLTATSDTVVQGIVRARPTHVADAVIHCVPLTGC